MTILVTGAAGYIGSHVALALTDSGEKVVALDNMSRGFRFPEAPNIFRAVGDIGDQQLLQTIFAEHNISAVINLAAFVSVEEGEREKELYFTNNAFKAHTLMRTAADAKVPYFIQSSTAAVYGQPKISMVDESAPLEPINNYGKSKVMAEANLHTVSTSKGRTMRYVALRYFNVAGCDPKGRTGYKLEVNPSHLIRKGLAVAGGRASHLEVFGTNYATPDGTCVRDYIHVFDLAQAHLSALRYLRSGGVSQIYNCGYGRGYSNLEVVRMIEKVTGKSTKYVVSDPRAGDPASLIADTTRIRNELDWIPYQDDLELMIADQFSWEQSQQK